MMLLLAEPAHGQDRARLRWRPGVGDSVAGYLVHVRRADVPTYPEPDDVGAGSVGSDGVLEHVIDGLDPHTAYVVAVTAYGSDGNRSARSNELMLSIRIHGSCVAVDDGAACDAADPCVLGSCRTDTCRLELPLMSVPGTALAARVVAGRRELLGKGAFLTLGKFDPTVAGARVELVGADGAVLYRVELPPGSFVAGPRRRVFRYVTAHPAPGGLRRLVFRRHGDVLRVRLRARARVSLRGATEPLSWIVHVGSSCVRELDLRCKGDGSRVRCN